jgi:hypothetical protein
MSRPIGSTRLLDSASRTSAALRAEVSAAWAAVACAPAAPDEDWFCAARVRAPFLAAADRLRSLALRVSAAFLAADDREVALGLEEEEERADDDLAREDAAEDFDLDAPDEDFDAFDDDLDERLDPLLRAPPELALLLD